MSGLGKQRQAGSGHLSEQEIGWAPQTLEGKECGATQTEVRSMSIEIAAG